MIVTDRALAETPMLAGIVKMLEDGGMQPLLFGDVNPNPTDENVNDGAAAFRDHSADSVVAIGGGSGLDAGKAIAMVARSNVALGDFEWTSPDPVLPAGTIPPILVIPTTSGTGAEMDSASMITDTANRVKLCVKHDECELTAVLDPELTRTLPANLTAWTGMDALTHAVEALSVDAYHPMCDAIALESMRLIQHNLVAAYKDGDNMEARAQMLSASSMAAVAFQKGLGAAHGLSEPIGAVHDTHHGLTNAVLLPYVLHLNRPKIEQKCELVARYLNFDAQPGMSGFDCVVKWVNELSDELDVPKSLADIGCLVTEEDAQICAAKAFINPTGMTNPVVLTEQDYAALFRLAATGGDPRGMRAALE
jgi:alcohol dehydrogenase class IV